MAKQELYERSPIRIFEEAANGGLKAGELGLVTAKKGLGKTSVLVQFGMDTLLNGKQLVHVSFNQHSENVISWYDGIYNEISKKKAIANAADVKEQILRNRTILNFNQETFALGKVVNTLKALKDGGINVSAIVVDGVDLSKVSAEDMKSVKDFAVAEKLTVWFSSTAEGEALSDSVPAAMADDFAAVIHISPRQDGVYVSVLKCHDMPATTDILKLDAKTLLMTAK